MRYSLLSAAILALTASVCAQDSTPFFDEITAPTEGQQVVAGKPFTIKWLPGDKPEYLNGTATIVLLEGSTTKDLQLGPTIATGVKNSGGSYVWDVPTDLKFTLYGLRITLDDDKTTTQKEDTIFQYSFPFQITKTVTGGTVTVNLGTGSAYTASSTSTSTTTRSIANSTSSITSTSASATASLSSSISLTTTSRTTSRTVSSSTPSATQPPPNSAVTNGMSGFLAVICGLLLAFNL